MAYRIDKREKQYEVLQLAEGGKVVKELHIELDKDNLYQQANARYNDLMEVQNKIKLLGDLGAAGSTKEQRDANFELVGKALISLFETVFGKENTEEILQFYGSNLHEMVEDIIPYIQKVIMPKLKEVVTEKRQAAKEEYLKKQRALFAVK